MKQKGEFIVGSRNVTDHSAFVRESAYRRWRAEAQRLGKLVLPLLDTEGEYVAGDLRDAAGFTKRQYHNAVNAMRKRGLWPYRTRRAGARPPLPGDPVAEFFLEQHAKRYAGKPVHRLSCSERNARIVRRYVREWKQMRRAAS